MVIDVECHHCEGEGTLQAHACTVCQGEGSLEYEVAERWAICPNCNGDGRHVHDALRTWTSSDIAEDPEGFSEMMAGSYDVWCEECSGSGKVKEPNFDAMDEKTAETVRTWLNLEAYERMVSESERKRGA